MATERNIVKAQELYESLARRWTVNYQLKIFGRILGFLLLRYIDGQ
jgi:hypothetical protein